jgi:hypothetical protein
MNIVHIQQLSQYSYIMNHPAKQRGCVASISLQWWVQNTTISCLRMHNTLILQYYPAGTLGDETVQSGPEQISPVHGTEGLAGCVVRRRAVCLSKALTGQSPGYTLESWCCTSPIRSLTLKAEHLICKRVVVCWQLLSYISPKIWFARMPRALALQSETGWKLLPSPNPRYTCLPGKLKSSPLTSGGMQCPDRPIPWHWYNNKVISWYSQ